MCIVLLCVRQGQNDVFIFVQLHVYLFYGSLFVSTYTHTHTQQHLCACMHWKLKVKSNKNLCVCMFVILTFFPVVCQHVLNYYKFAIELFGSLFHFHTFRLCRATPRVSTKQKAFTYRCYTRVYVCLRVLCQSTHTHILVSFPYGFFYRYTRETKKRKKERKNIPSLVVVILWLAVASFPYYVMDYLIWV